MEKLNETKNLTAMLVLEILGRPAEHLTSTLNKLIEEMDNEQRVSVKEKKVAEPKEIEEQKGFYSSFAEVEVETEGILDLITLCFKYMPAYVEIINPELIAVTNNSWSEILSEILRRLHQYDEVARVLQNERMIIESKLREVLEEKKKDIKDDIKVKRIKIEDGEKPKKKIKKKVKEKIVD